jgi:hypothetical protein
MNNYVGKGCIGYFTSGILKTGNVVIAKLFSVELTDIYEEYIKIYGNGLSFRYALCENVDEAFALLHLCTLKTPTLLHHFQ